METREGGHEIITRKGYNKRLQEKVTRNGDKKRLPSISSHKVIEILRIQKYDEKSTNYLYLSSFKILTLNFRKTNFQYKKCIQVLH